MAKRKHKYTGLQTKTLDLLWSKKVKEKAGHKCEICGGTESLNAHHIQPRHIYATRWYVPNGVCLCVGCHTRGDYSAHKNPAYFYDKMTGIRGIVWLRELIEQTLKKDWHKNLEQIKESLK